MVTDPLNYGTDLLFNNQRLNYGTDLLFNNQRQHGRKLTSDALHYYT
jgi:hypothetical protein